MSDINKRVLRVVLHGIDSRGTKIMAMYFQGPCKGGAQLVADPENADVDMYDGDVSASKQLLAAHLQEQLSRPALVLSLQDFVHKGVLHIKKPVQVDDMLRIIAETKKQLGKKAKKYVINPSTQQDDANSERKDMFEFDIEQAKLFSSEDSSDEHFENEFLLDAQITEDSPTELASYPLKDGIQPVVSVPDTAIKEAQHKKTETTKTEVLEKDWFNEWFESQLPNGEE